MSFARAPEFRGTTYTLPGASRRSIVCGVVSATLATALAAPRIAAARSGTTPFTPPDFLHRPDLHLEHLEGGQAEKLWADGGIVLVHFFATWCEPCRDEFASLDKLVSHLGSDLSILAISVGEVAVRVRKFVETLRPSFPVLLDVQRKTAKAWGVSALPTTFVLDRARMPRLVVERDLDWADTDVVSALTALLEHPSKTELTK